MGVAVGGTGVAVAVGVGVAVGGIGVAVGVGVKVGVGVAVGGIGVAVGVGVKVGVGVGVAVGGTGVAVGVGVAVGGIGVAVGVGVGVGVDVGVGVGVGVGAAIWIEPLSTWNGTGKPLRSVMASTVIVSGVVVSMPSASSGIRRTTCSTFQPGSLKLKSAASTVFVGLVGPQEPAPDKIEQFG